LLTAWAGYTSENKEIYLRRAGVYLNTRYEFQGYKVERNQAMQFPRTGVVCDGFSIPSDEIPDNLKNAQMELALKAASEPLFADVAGNANVRREKVDVLETEFFSPPTAQKKYYSVNRMIECLTNGLGNRVNMLIA